nr:uncharacterized protein LOC109757390 isoform X5 [Aegilops tauschii subsp. strangulata]
MAGTKAAMEDYSVRMGFVDDYICAICDEGGDLICCDGDCGRSFHPTKPTGEASHCDTLGLSEEQLNYLSFCAKIVSLRSTSALFAESWDLQTKEEADRSSYSAIKGAVSAFTTLNVFHWTSIICQGIHALCMNATRARKNMQHQRVTKQQEKQREKKRAGKNMQRRRVIKQEENQREGERGKWTWCYAGAAPKHFIGSACQGKSMAVKVKYRGYGRLRVGLCSIAGIMRW